MAKGLRELHQVGLLDDAPHTAIYGAQARGCSPVATAFEEPGTDDTYAATGGYGFTVEIGPPGEVTRQIQQVYDDALHGRGWRSSR